MREFNEKEVETLKDIILYRRDVRGNRFTDQPVPQEVLDDILFAGVNAPSVGFSQPWEFVIVDDFDVKNKVKDTFLEENEKAKELFKDGKLDAYTALKLEGITEAPVNIAVFYKPSDHPVLGQTSMKEVGEYSVVCAIQNMWLMARSLNVGLGWVSILDPVKVKKVLNAPEDRKLIAYLCLGYVDFFFENPELERLDWRKRKNKDEVVFKNSY
ncbi:MAG: 5,6-dimethylbenzimidazole synthase [Crocinitomicaceae bacterium]|nr:5,6-dimethylbenzimidazole synthase [Flavobacteriales bacterium]NQZ36812.1 5,6-dimethylbenzimidazole synthase [Crocinitomicaceae bacterium]